MKRMGNRLKKLLPVRSNPVGKTQVSQSDAPRTALGLLIQLYGLVGRQNRTDAALRQNREKILEYKRREVTAQSCRKLDDAICRAYFADGGIRFHAEILVEHVSLLDPEEDTVNTMWVRCYSSAIAYMCEALQDLERESRQWLGQDAQTAFQEEEALYKAIGYTPCRERIRGLKGLSPRQLARELPQLRQTVLENEQNIQQLLRQCEEQPAPAVLRYGGLLNTLQRLLNPETVERLGTEEGWSPAGYAQAVTRFADGIRQQLIEAYPRPGAPYATQNKPGADDRMG